MTVADPIDEMFAGLDDYYPGSKRKRRERPRQETPKSEGWESRPVIKKVGGVDTPMYTIGALAQALGKSEKSVRLWIRRGYFPSAPYRMPSVTGKDGITRLGRRLYSKEMVEAAVRAFERRGLIDTPRVEWSRHTDVGPELQREWDEIRTAPKHPNTQTPNSEE